MEQAATQFIRFATLEGEKRAEFFCTFTQNTLIRVIFKQQISLLGVDSVRDEERRTRDLAFSWR